MATPAEKLQILVIQHLEHAGIEETVVASVKEAFEKSAKKGAGSTLYDLFTSATGEGAPKAAAPAPPQQTRKQSVQQQQMQQQQQQQQQRLSMQGQQTRASAQMSNQQASMMQQQIMPDQKPVIAKEPTVRNQKLDEQLMAAAKAGSVDTIPGLINSGAYVNMQDRAGTSPLLAATEADKIDVVKVLLQNGADVNLARPDGTSPLLCAYKGNKKKVLKELTAGAFKTLNQAVHQHGHIGGAYMMDPMEDEGVTAMDMCQLKDEAGKLFKLQAHPEVPPPVAKNKIKKEETMVDLSGPADLSNLRVGGVRLLMQELCQATQKLS